MIEALSPVVVLRCQIMCSNTTNRVRMEHWHTWQRLCIPKDLTLIVTRFGSPWFQLIDAHWKTGLQYKPQSHRWAKGFCKPLMVGDEETSCQKSLQELQTAIRACYCPRRWPHWIIGCLWVLVSHYVIMFIQFHSKLCD